MATVHLDYLEGHQSGSKDERGWKEHTRIVRVTEVSGVGYQQLENAIETFGVPQIGELHPSIFGFRVTGLNPEAIDDTVVEIKVKYERRDDASGGVGGGSSPADQGAPVTYEITTSLVAIETYRDSHKRILYTEYPETGGKKKNGRITIFLPVTVIVITRRETANPLQETNRFIGCYNSGIFSIGNEVITTDERDWRCEGYTATSSDNGESWDTTITLQRAPIYPDGTCTYDQEIAWTKDDGDIPQAIIENPDDFPNGVKTVDAAPEIDFQEMGLS